LIGAIIHIMHVVHNPLKPESDHITSSWIPATVRKWDKPINEMAEKYNVDPNLIAIIITMESGGNAKAHSEADAKGLMQITPPTAQDIAAKFLKEPTQKYDLLDPKTNIEFGTAYLSYLRDEFGTEEQGPTWNSTVELIAAGYNGGPGASNRLEQGKGLTDVETVVYSRDAFNMWRERHAKTSPTFDRWKERGGKDLLDQAKAQK
jgi:soluble lytic murein transglycosylase-like protein